MKKITFIVILFSLSVPASLFAQETVSCSIEPYSQVLEEKKSVAFSYSLSGGGDASRLSLGGLPGGVTGEFSAGDKLVVTALQGAQLGSFDVSVLYNVQEDGAISQSVCSFNIIIEPSKDRDETQEYIPLPSHSQQATAAIEKGEITVEAQTTPEPSGEETSTPADSAEDKFVSPLYVGIRSDEVEHLQTILKEAGYFPSWVQTSGYYGEITEKAVLDFQAGQGIDIVGFVGPLTRVALNNL